MQGFADETYIDVSSGNGGAGCVSFRREKYVPKGGPDGGDGGRGGDVIFSVKNNTKTLLHLKQKRHFRAENGHPGQGRKKHGKNGIDVIIDVPPGTLIKDPETGRVLKDLTGEDQWVFLKGGIGGKGNTNFVTSRHQAPRYAQPGMAGQECRVHLELNLIADVGLVGFPNAGKSSLLSAMTNANPKIADYPFTTKIPNLGMLKYYDKDIVFADIPGIIEGASDGAGLGLKFLKHIYRTRMLLFLIDLGDPEYLTAFEKLKLELSQYAPELMNRPRLVVGSKIDLFEGDDNIRELARVNPDETVMGISNFTRKGLEEMIRYVAGHVLEEGCET
ncbi:MAG: GTPase ObgE [Spirochaetales bacterium]|nr:GTPase ObgE [Spirochaetales bacterium]